MFTRNLLRQATVAVVIVLRFDSFLCLPVSFFASSSFWVIVGMNATDLVL
jgi:hypothetical protein